jgi:hypothetical protein
VVLVVSVFSGFTVTPRSGFRGFNKTFETCSKLYEYYNLSKARKALSMPEKFDFLVSLRYK